MISSIKHILLVGLAIMIGLSAFGQRKVELENADQFEGGRTDGKRYNRFIGNVHFLHGSTEIWCDSALFYKKDNTLEAFGNVRVFDKVDSVHIAAERLIYDGDSQLANLRNNVVYREDSVVLYTDILDYDLFTRSAIYYSGGRINDGQNRLTSIKGYYDALAKTMSFKNEVVLKNPRNTLKTDSLFYDMVTKIAIAVGPTEIITSDGEVVNTEKGGRFNMQANRTTIVSGQIETESYILRGDELFYDRANNNNRARGNVYMYSKADQIIITGDGADNIEKTGITKIYGNPLMKKVFEGDTLYLVADTLMSIDDTLDVNKRLLAYSNVRFFRDDLQGISDSLAYFLADSILNLYNDPVLWSEGNQIIADSIYIVFENNQISTLNLMDNAFMILQDTVDNFNQLKGKKMTGYFENNDIQRLTVTGNSESLFHALDEDDSTLLGVNRTLCSNMAILFKNNRANKVKWYQNVESTFIPPHELTKPDLTLEGFNWRKSERPVLINLLNRKEPEEEPEAEVQANDNQQVIRPDE